MKRVRAEQGRILRYENLGQVERKPQRDITRYEAVPFSPLEEHATKLIVHSGKLLSEHTVGGLAKRINDEAKVVRFGPKFLIRPRDLAREVDASGYDHLLDLTLGERHFFQQAYAFYKLAQEMGGEHWTNVLARQFLSVVDNTAVNRRVAQSFMKYGFFGFDSAQVLFNSSEFYPGLDMEKGKVFIDEEMDEQGHLKHSRIHNHGVVPMQACMEDTFFTVDPQTGHRTVVPRWRYKQILGTMQDMISYNVEDLDFFLVPIDYKGIGIAMRFAREGYLMVMELLSQKVHPYDPQPGGMLCFDPKVFNPLTSQMGRLVVIESFRLDLPPEKIVIDEDEKAPNPAYVDQLRSYAWLNRNNNHFLDPLAVTEIVERQGLPVHPEVYIDEKDGALRIGNLTPQGDINLLVPTAYVVRDVPIASLKRRSDIPLTLKRLAAQDGQDGGAFKRWLSREFATAGVVFPDHPFKTITQLSATIPIDLNTILAHPWFMRRSSPRFQSTLSALSEVFKVDGSLVYRARLEGEQTILQVIADTRRGSGINYPSRAAEQEIPARDIKNLVFREHRVWTGQKAEGDFSYILVANRQPGETEGEVVLLLGKYDETVPKERKSFLLKEKLEKVLEYARSHGLEEAGAEKMHAEFQELSWQFLFENSASAIEKELEKRVIITP
jgi:hypothetical protein